MSIMVQACIAYPASASFFWPPSSSLLSDVDKPTIWLETTAVELYRMVLVPIDICAEQFWNAQVFLIPRVLVQSRQFLQSFFRNFRVFANLFCKFPGLAWHKQTFCNFKFKIMLSMGFKLQTP